MVMPLPFLESYFVRMHFQVFKKDLVAKLLEHDRLYETDREIALGDATISQQHIDQTYAILEKKAEQIPYANRTPYQHLICAWKKLLKNDLKTAEKMATEAKNLLTDVVETAEKMAVEAKDLLENNPEDEEAEKLKQQSEVLLFNSFIYYCEALLGEIALKNNTPENAIENCKSVIQVKENHSPAYILNLRALLKQKVDRAAFIEEFPKIQYFDTTPSKILKGYIFYQEKKYAEVCDLLKYYYANHDFADKDVFAFICGLHIIAYAKSANNLGLVDGISDWKTALQANKVDIFACPGLSREEKNYIRGIFILFENIGELETSIMLVDAENNPTISKPENITTPEHEALANLKIALNKHLSVVLHEADADGQAKAAITEALLNADKILKEKNQASKIVKNIFLAIGLLGLGYLIAGCINYRCTNGRHFAFFTDKNQRIVEKIADQAISEKSLLLGLKNVEVNSPVPTPTASPRSTPSS